MEDALETAKAEKANKEKVIKTLHATVEKLNKEIPKIEIAQMK